MKPAPRPRGARGRARSFRNNAFVTGGFGVRFYVGTPLVASDGHRLGTLCFADAAPRAFDAERCNILNTLAELVVRELERGWAMRAARKSAAQMQQARPGARGRPAAACTRALACRSRHAQRRGGAVRRRPPGDTEQLWACGAPSARAGGRRAERAARPRR